MTNQYQLSTRPQQQTQQYGSTSNIQVTLRVRPLIKREIMSNCHSCIQVKNNTILLRETLNTQNDNENLYNSYLYTFDNILENVSSQKVYDITTATCIDRFVNYINSVIIAYGVTSSGKTYTINEILSIALDHILEQKAEDAELSMSFFQIYNEQIYDLIDPANQKLQIKQSQDGQIQIAQLSTYNVQTKEDMLYLLAVGNEYRATAETTLNQASSRSHSILTFYLRSKSNYSKLSFIDLAGSEKFNFKNSQQVVNEAKYINKSLTALGNVMQQLVKHQKDGLTYINFRDSKLTLFLKDSVGGNCFLSVITTISPSNEQLYETLNSLKFADRAKQIQQHEQVNVIPVEQLTDNYDETIQMLQQQIESLEKQVLLKQQQIQNNSQQIVQNIENDNSFSGLEQVESLYDEINYIDEQRIKQINDQELINQNKLLSDQQQEILKKMNQTLEELEDYLSQLKVQNINVVIPECTDIQISQYMENMQKQQQQQEDLSRQTPKSSVTQFSCSFSETREKHNGLLSYQQKLQELSKIRGEQYNQQQQLQQQLQDVQERIDIKKNFLQHQIQEAFNENKKENIDDLLYQCKQEKQLVIKILQDKVINIQGVPEQELIKCMYDLVSALQKSQLRQKFSIIANDFI